MTKASKGPCATITPSDTPLVKVALRRAARQTISPTLSSTVPRTYLGISEADFGLTFVIRSATLVPEIDQGA